MTKKSNLWKHIVLIISCVIIVTPLVFMVSTSLKSMSEILMAKSVTLFPVKTTFEAFGRLWSNYPFLNYIKNSLIVVVSSTLITITFSTLAGYGFSRFKFKGHAGLMLFILTTQMFPSAMLFVPYYKLLSMYHLTNTYFGLIIVYVANTIPFCTWMLYGYFNSISTEIDEAALIDGCGRFRTFWSIVLPLTLPGLISTVIYAFVMGWNEYMFAMIFINDEAMKTLPLAIGQMGNAYEVYWNELMAGSLLSSVPLILMFLFMQRYFISGMTGGAVKG